MRSVTVLQLEDDENDVLLLQHAFTVARVPYTVKTVSDGQQAIDYLSGAGKFADRIRYPMPAVVLLDLKTPVKSGLDVLTWMRGRREFDALIAIVFTASSSPDDIADAYRLHANSFVVKPSGVDKLADFVRALQSYWIEQNRR